MAFPRTHLYIVSMLSLGLCSLVAAKFAEDPPRPYAPDAAVYGATTTSPAPLPVVEPTPREPTDTETPNDASETATADNDASLSPEPAPAPNLKTIELKIKPGDSLAVLFDRHSVSRRDLAHLAASQPLGPRLKSIFPGHQLTLEVSDDGQLHSLTYTPGPLERIRFDRAGDSFFGQRILQEPTRVHAFKHGVIDHSLFVASQRAGLNEAVTMRLAQIFQWDIDFVLDIRKGDEFMLVYEELHLNDELIGYGEVLAAEFVNRGTSYRAVRYVDSNDEYSYYSPDGRNMRKAFLRAPVEFSRISSNFNLRRKHPLHKRTMPHRGIDYAAPTNTPILAAGDGRVKAASRSASNGNFVVIQHGEQFTTKYLHLSKFGRGIRKGAKVKQGQTIGYVGSTGWATGPHLHYEFLVNGVHMNPRTVKLPDAEPLPESERTRFSAHSSTLLAMLDSYRGEAQIAAGR